MPHTTSRPLQKWLAKHASSPARGTATLDRLRAKLAATPPACRYCGGEVSAQRKGSEARWCSTEHWIEDVNLVL
ncbi:hypothetical protein EDD25_1491 [Cryobacterium psychrophilum]|nr:hypothetical protein EDD25_1491 [Cryobacterium psychrophilum]